ncbi:MAG: chorismate mutase [Candidatus Jordarchaeaceae archaeon]
MNDIAEIDNMRKQIEKITLEIIRLCGERVKLSKRMGEIKASMGIPVENKQVEKHLRDKVLESCRTLGLNEDFCLNILKILLEESKRVQNNLTKL